MASEGDTVEVGQVIATVGEGSGNASSSKEESSDQSQSANNDEATKELAQPTESQSTMKKRNLISNNQRVNATPSARRHARENGVDLSTVSGKGNDVVRKDDVENSQKRQSQSSQETSKKKNLKNLQVHLINL